MTSKQPLPNKSRGKAMDIRPKRTSVSKSPAKTVTKPSSATIGTITKATPKTVKTSSTKVAKKTTKKKPSLFKRLTNHPLKQHPFVIPVVTFVALTFLSMVVFVVSNGQTIGASDTKLVKLNVDGEQQVIPTRAETVGDMLDKLDITVQEKDIVQPAVDTEIVDNSVTVNVYKARPITIVDGDKETTVIAAAPTPRDAVAQSGVTVYPEDKVETHTGAVETEDVLKGELVAEKIVIDRATPAIINLYGTSIPVRTHVATVGDALKEKNIQTLPDDVITPAPETPLTDKTQIFIVRVGKQIDSREEVIAMPVETVNDPTLPVGTTQVKTAGTPGKKVVTYEIDLQNGAEVSRKPIQEVVAVEPVKQVVLKGTKPPTIIVAGDHAALMTQAGIPADQQGAAEFIISRESGWRLTARNSGGCLGLGQACPGSKLIAACPDYANDPVCQIRFFNGYAVGRYGSWNGAYNFWQVNHWW